MRFTVLFCRAQIESEFFVTAVSQLPVLPLWKHANVCKCAEPFFLQQSNKVGWSSARAVCHSPAFTSNQLLSRRHCTASIGDHLIIDFSGLESVTYLCHWQVDQGCHCLLIWTLPKSWPGLDMDVLELHIIM